jgi:hypothetical protein
VLDPQFEAWGGMQIVPSEINPNGWGLVGDQKSFALPVYPAEPQRLYTYLCNRTMEFKYSVRNANTREVIKVHNYSYSWSNDPHRWNQDDVPAPPIGIHSCAASHLNDGRDPFYNVLGILNPEALP